MGQRTAFFLAGTAMMVWLFLVAGGCTKEYSYKRISADTTGSVPPTPVATTYCAKCTAAALPDSSWRLTIDGVRYCGKVDRGIMNYTRTAFTFFGPSFCSADSGFVASVYIDNEVLDSDKTEVKARVACYYYDHVQSTNYFVSSSGNPLQATVTHFSAQDKTAAGTFSGTVTLYNGTAKEVENGEFRVHF